MSSIRRKSQIKKKELSMEKIRLNDRLIRYVNIGINIIYLSLSEDLEETALLLKKIRQFVNSRNF